MAILTSRKFWAAILGVLVVVVSTFLPNFSLDSEAGAGLLVIVVSYIIGVAVDPGPGGWKGVIQSRKFWAALIGIVVMILGGLGIQLPFGLTEAQLVEIAAVIGTFISGVALEGLVRVAKPEA